MLLTRIVERIAKANKCAFMGTQRLSFTRLHATKYDDLAKYDYCFNNCKDSGEKLPDNISLHCDFSQNSYDPRCFLA